MRPGQLLLHAARQARPNCCNHPFTCGKLMNHLQKPAWVLPSRASSGASVFASSTILLGLLCEKLRCPPAVSAVLCSETGSKDLMAMRND